MLELLLQSRLKRRRRTRVVQLLYRLWECRMSLQATQKGLPDAPARPARARPPSSAQSRWGKKQERRKLHRLTWRGLVVKTELVKRLPNAVALQTREQLKTVTDEVIQDLESRSMHTADMPSCTDLPRHSFYVYPPCHLIQTLEEPFTVRAKRKVGAKQEVPGKATKSSQYAIAARFNGMKTRTWWLLQAADADKGKSRGANWSARRSADSVPPGVRRARGTASLTSCGA